MEANRDSSILGYLNKRLSSKLVALGLDEQKPVSVLAIQRYLTANVEGQPPKPPSYSYDITVTDGVWKTKFFLKSDLSHLVNSNTVKTGIDIIIVEYSFFRNPKRRTHGYMVVSELRCVPGKSTILPKISHLESLPLLVRKDMVKNPMLKSDVPLEINTSHYLPLWNNDDPVGHEWCTTGPSEEQDCHVPDYQSLKDIQGANVESLQGAPLLLKILHKSTLKYCGNVRVESNYSYEARFEVADFTGSMSMVLVNEMCLRFYNRLHVGTVILIHDYVLKPYSCDQPRPQMTQYFMTHFMAREISVTAINPASFLMIIPEKKIQRNWGLPSIAYRFVSRLCFERMPRNSICDIVCLITYVGRVERIRSKPGTVPEKFSVFRWIHAIDETSTKPFIVKLFAGPEMESFYDISPLSTLVCTQMRLCHGNDALPYLESSHMTETQVSGFFKNREYMDERKVRTFVRWVRELVRQMIKQKAYVGGHYSYPPHSMMVNPAVSMPGKIPLVTLADLRNESQSLHYRETKTVAIRGFLVAVSYMEKLKTPEASATKQQVRAEVVPGPSYADSDLTEQATGAKRRKLTQEEGAVRSNLEEPPVQEGVNPLAWEMNTWAMERRRLPEHFKFDGLHRDSITHKCTGRLRHQLLKEAAIQPMRWSPKPRDRSDRSITCPGYFLLTILGLDRQIAVDLPFIPVMGPTNPRFFGTPMKQHANNFLSILLSGYICETRPPTESGERILPEPKEIMQTCQDLGNLKIDCIVDLCHLGGDQMEMIVDQVYRAPDV